MRERASFGIFLALSIVAEAQFSRTIPPESEAGHCSCQSLPTLLGRYQDIFKPRDGNVIFTVYTRSTVGDEGKEVRLDDASSLANSGFNPRLILSVIIHGFQETPKDSAWIYTMKDALLSKADMNVIIVDWSKLSRSIIYNLAASDAKHTGVLLGNFLHFIKKVYPSFSGSQVHLIGFSMGAHVAGIAGHHFREIARITGLDPAGPAFECIDDSQRLERSDASFVHAIHTNGGCRHRGHIGYRTPIGHQDFYVNGGGKQPGCGDFNADAVFDFATLRRPHVCHHHRAVAYFIESIRARETPHGFICPNYETFKLGACLDNQPAGFGYHANSAHRGIYFLMTQSEPTYLAKHLKLEVHIGTGGNRITQGQLLLKVSSRSGVGKEYVLLRSSMQLPRKSHVYSSMITVPLEMDVEDVHFTLRYEPLGIPLIPYLNNYLDVLKILAIEPTSKMVFCISPRDSILISTPYYVKSRRGNC